MLSANSDITTDTENDVSIDVELDAPVTAGDKRSMGSAAPPPPSSVRLAVYHLLRWVRILGFPFVFVLYWVRVCVRAHCARVWLTSCHDRNITPGRPVEPARSLRVLPGESCGVHARDARLGADLAEQYAIENGYVWRDALYIAVGLLGLVAVKMTWSEKSSAQVRYARAHDCGGH